MDPKQTPNADEGLDDLGEPGEPGFYEDGGLGGNLFDDPEKIDEEDLDDEYVEEGLDEKDEDGWNPED